MGNEHKCSSFGFHLKYAIDALSLKGSITNGEHLINEDDFREDVNGDAKPESSDHTAGVALNGNVDKLSQFRELDDIAEKFSHLLWLHSLYSGIQENILSTGALQVEPSSKRDQRRKPSMNGRMTVCWTRDAAKDTQHSRLSRAVASNECHGFSGSHGERYVLQSPEDVVRIARRSLKRLREQSRSLMAQANLVGLRPVTLPDVIRSDDGR